MSITLATIAFLAAANRPVDFTFAAAPLDQVVAKLAEATGQRLSVSPILANEVVLVDVRRAEPSTVLERLALVCGARWVQGSDGNRLELDVELDKKERQVALDERIKILKDEIVRLEQESRKQGEFDPQKFQQGLDEARKLMEQARNQADRQAGPPQGLQQLGGLMNGMPANRAIVKLLATMRVDDLAKIAPGQRVVFTTAPTRMQRMLPSNGVQVMRQFVAEQNKLAQSMRGLRGAIQSGRGGQTGNRPTTGGTAPTDQAQSAPPVPTKAFLVVTRFGANDGLGLQLLVSDATGQVVGQGSMNLLSVRPNAGLPAPATGVGAEKPFVLSDVSVSSVNVFALGGRGPQGGGPRGGGRPDTGSARPQLPELKTALSQPDKFDPLSIHVEETVGILAKDANIVALLPDSLLLASARTLSRNPAPSQLQTAFEQQWSLSVENKDGWLMVRPLKRFEARESRVDRKALARLIQASKGDAGLRLDDVAAYSLKAPVAAWGGLDLAVMRAVDPADADMLQQAYGDNRDVLMMYAAMTPLTRNTLLQGKPVAASGVSNNAAPLLLDLVYNSPDGPRVNPTTGATGQGRNAANGQGNVRNAGGRGGNGQTRGGRGRGGGGGGGQEAFVGPELLAQVAGPQEGPGGQGRRNGGRGGFGQGGPGGGFQIAGPGGAMGGFQMGGPGGGQRGFGMGNVMTERTEVLPTGVPGGATLTVNARSEQIAKAVQADTGASRVFTPQSMATERAMSDNPVQTDRPLTSVQWTGFVPGERKTLIFTFTFAPGVTMSRSLQDTSYQGSSVTSVDKLPGDFFTRYTASYRQAQERFAQMQQRTQNGGRGGQRQRPPGP